MSAENKLFSAFSFITFILVLIPFPWHFEAWNTGTCLYMAWTAVGLLSLFINSVVWSDNAIDFAPVWCDISSKIIIGISVAIPAASLCINHRLYCIAAVRTVTKSKAEKRRDIMVDLAIGVGIPVLVMALHYIVQGHRYNIFEEIGCYPSTYNTPPAYALVFMMPVVIGLASGTYSIMSILAFRKRHAEFKEILSANKNLSSNRFLRLMALAGIEVLCSVPLGISSMVLNATRGVVSPWISWEDTHFNFSRVDQILAINWKLDPTTKTGLDMTRWLVVVCGLIFFAFFGFADEAQKHYKLAFNSVAKRVGISTTGATKVGTGMSYAGSSGFGKFKAGVASNISSFGFQGAKLPIFITETVDEKRDSMESFSDMTSVKDLSDFGSSAASLRSSTFDTLTKDSTSNQPEISKPAALTVSTTMTKPNTPLQGGSSRPSSPHQRPVSAVSPTGSFLDLSTTVPEDSHLRRNDNIV